MQNLKMEREKRSYIPKALRNCKKKYLNCIKPSRKSISPKSPSFFNVVQFLLIRNGLHKSLMSLQVSGQVIEVKTPLSHRDYSNLIPQEDGNHFLVYKTRRCFLYNNQYFQLDIYKEPCHERCRVS